MEDNKIFYDSKYPNTRLLLPEPEARKHFSNLVDNCVEGLELKIVVDNDDCFVGVSRDRTVVRTIALLRPRDYNPELFHMWAIVRLNVSIDTTEVVAANLTEIESIDWMQHVREELDENKVDILVSSNDSLMYSVKGEGDMFVYIRTQEANIAKGVMNNTI